MHGPGKLTVHPMDTKELNALIVTRCFPDQLINHAGLYETLQGRVWA